MKTLTSLQPIFRKFRLQEKEQEKCPESAFKLLFYSSAYGYCFYLLFNGKYKFFQDTKNCWRGEANTFFEDHDLYFIVFKRGFQIICNGMWQGRINELKLPKTK